MAVNRLAGKRQPTAEKVQRKCQENGVGGAENAEIPLFAL